MKTKKENYSPLYFLSALGSGGLSVAFFMYLQFMIPHKKIPMVTFNDIKDVVLLNDYTSFFTIVALLGIAFFSINHFRLLYINLQWFKDFKKTPEFEKFQNSSAGIGLMAVPLTLAMSLNVILIIGAISIPGLWTSIEYLFPITFSGFLAVGIYASVVFAKHMLNVVIKGDVSFVNSSNLSQLLSIFTFSMISVGFAAPGAMSHNLAMNALGLFFAIFFLSMALLIALVKFVLGFKAILENGIDKEAAPTLWLIIPFLTLGGITLVRLLFGLDHHFDDELSSSSLFVLTSIVLTLQILNGVFGYAVMKKIGYFKEFVNGEGKSVGSFSLICPGVAFFVFGMFFLHFGLVQNGIIEKFSVMYFLFLLPFLAIKAATILTYFKLGKKLL